MALGLFGPLCSTPLCGSPAAAPAPSGHGKGYGGILWEMMLAEEEARRKRRLKLAAQDAEIAESKKAWDAHLHTEDDELLTLMGAR